MTSIKRNTETVKVSQWWTRALAVKCRVCDAAIGVPCRKRVLFQGKYTSMCHTQRVR